MSIFEERKNLKPYEYGGLIQFWEAIQHAYWIHSEYNFTSDIQDFHTKLDDYERWVVERTMLAISQVEVAVKSFWWNVGWFLKKPEIQAVWAVFAESEVRHANLYSHVIELLGLNSRFESLLEVPCMKERYNYLSSMSLKQEATPKELLKSLILFSLLTEHCALFSQFYILMRFNKEKNVFSWIVNWVQASTAEEQIHWDFWIALINIIRKEHPELFTKELEKEVYDMVDKAYDAEFETLMRILWDDPVHEFDYEVQAFLEDRYDRSLIAMWYQEHFPQHAIKDETLEKTQWFYDELLTTTHTDFFAKRSINYTKKNKSFTDDDLF